MPSLIDRTQPSPSIAQLCNHIVPAMIKFTAVVDFGPGREPALHVSGLVETNSTIEQPVLWLDDTQIPMSRTLSLNLAIRKVSDIGTPEVRLRPAQFVYPASAGEFKSISICWAGREVMYLKVTETR